MINENRDIKKEEKNLICAMVELALVPYLKDGIPETVSAYNPKQLESINLSMNKNMDYDGDILRVEYTDLDLVLVTITLTKNKSGQLLDLDFWKEGFIPVKEYPTPEKIKVVP